MVGFVIGLLVGALLGFMLMAFIKVGSDDLEQYYIDLIQTYDKEVKRQYKCINKAIHRIQLIQMDGEVSIKDLGKLANILMGVDK